MGSTEREGEEFRRNNFNSFMPPPPQSGVGVLSLKCGRASSMNFINGIDRSDNSQEQYESIISLIFKTNLLHQWVVPARTTNSRT